MHAHLFSFSDLTPEKQFKARTLSPCQGPLQQNNLFFFLLLPILEIYFDSSYCKVAVGFTEPTALSAQTFAFSCSEVSLGTYLE